LEAIPARIKKRALRPRIAKIFEVKTMKGSLVIAKIAGTLSTAKMMSVNSMKISVRRRGVPMRRPASLTRNFPS
jgi:hypothetical protein